MPTYGCMGQRCRFTEGKLKAEYNFLNLLPFVQPKDDVHLGLLKVDRIPPHLILTIGEKYFSLEKARCVVNGDLGLLVAKLNRNGTACLFLPLPHIAKGDAIQLANAVYLKFPAANNGFTCLDPIKLFTATAYGWKTEQAAVVFDIIDVLANQDTIKTSAQLNTPEAEVSLTRYTLKDVALYIEELR